MFEDKKPHRRRRRIPAATGEQIDWEQPWTWGGPVSARGAFANLDALLNTDPVLIPTSWWPTIEHRLARQEAMLVGGDPADRFAVADAIGLGIPLDPVWRGLPAWTEAELDWAGRVIAYTLTERMPDDPDQGRVRAALAPWVAAQQARWAQLTVYQRARLLIAGIRPGAAA